MTNMTLQDWENNRWVERHNPDRQEILDLLAVADRDLHDCQAAQMAELALELRQKVENGSRRRIRSCGRRKWEVTAPKRVRTEPSRKKVRQALRRKKTEVPEGELPHMIFSTGN